MAIVGELIIMVGFRLIVVVPKPILVTSRYGKCFLTLCCNEQYVCASFLRTWQRKALRHIPSESRCYEVVTIVPLCRRCFDFALRGGTGWSLGFHLVPYMRTWLMICLSNWGVGYKYLVTSWPGSCILTLHCLNNILVHGHRRFSDTYGRNPQVSSCFYGGRCFDFLICDGGTVWVAGTSLVTD